jgi:endonuclease/exonuclease/phosphatase family metal-dependent hydrolase
VLVRDNVTVLSGEVLAKTPSDHLPVRARLRVKDAAGSGKEGAVG